MDTSVFPGQPATFMCEVQSTIPLQFTWYLNEQLNLPETESHMNTTASSMFTLYNVSYTDDNSTVRCSANGSSLTVNSDNVSLTGKSLWLTFRSLQRQCKAISYICIYTYVCTVYSVGRGLVVYKHICMHVRTYISLLGLLSMKYV